MNHSSLSSELPVGPEPDRPRSALVSSIVLIGVCSALVLTAPVLIRSLTVLLSARTPGSWMPSLLEVCLALIGVLALSSVALGSVSDLRSRLSSGRRRWRRHRRPWEEFLMETEALEARASASSPFGSHAEPPASTRQARSRQIQEMPVRNPRSMATLRLVEATPWPLGSVSDESNQNTRGYRRGGPATQLAFPAAVRPLENPTNTPAWHNQNPEFLTPVPFSVWSYHDNLPNDYEEDYEAEPRHTWLWATLFFAGLVLAATLWWRVHGISLPSV